MKNSVLVEYGLLLEHVVAGPRQFVRQRLGGHRSVSAGFLAVVKAFGRGAETQYEGAARQRVKSEKRTRTEH
ncbi:MAG: hypothetical protein JWP59_1730 [Massilia sp.]|nr:hypothetical protein [Massilia sp.]